MKPTPLLAALAALLILPASAWDNDVPMFDEVVADKLAAAKPADTKSAAAKPSAAKPGAAKPAATAADSFSSSKPKAETPVAPETPRKAQAPATSAKPKPSGGSSGALSFGKPKAAESAELVTVEAKGQGETVEAAKKDAARNAIKKAVGELVDAKTLVENDELVEDKILTLSNAMIEKADYGDAKSVGDGLFEVPVKAVVKKGRLNQELKAIGIATGAVAGDSLAAKLGSGRERIANAEKFFGERFKGFPGNFMEAAMLVKADGSPAVDIDVETGHVFANVELRANMENYLEWAKQLQEVLEAVCVSKNEMTLAFKDDIYEARWTLPRESHVSAKFDLNVSRDTFPVVLVTPKKVERDVWPATVFHLDGQISKALWAALKARLPQNGIIEVKLTDGEGDAVCSANGALLSCPPFPITSKFFAGPIGTMDFATQRCWPFPMAGCVSYDGSESFIVIAPAPALKASRHYLKIVRQKRCAWRFDLGMVSEDDLAEVAGYEVKVEYDKPNN